jgi:putative ubiquitin-RnfH superfamily antitoxin RatB of RatAB toxin-antitoxin module
MAPVERLRVEVVYCPDPQRADVAELELPAGATVLQALRASGLLERHPGIDLTRQRCGVWGRLGGLDDVLKDGDRVELYRPLAVDPKEARRRRQHRQRESRGAAATAPGNPRR